MSAAKSVFPARNNFHSFLSEQTKSRFYFFCQSDLLELEPSQRNETKKVEIEKKKERNTFFCFKIRENEKLQKILIRRDQK